MKAARTLASPRESSELLGEHVVRADGVPGFRRHFRLFVRGGRDAAEIHFRHALDFVVVIEHDAAQARDAEILVQHVAGEDIGRGQLPDRVAVLAHRRLQQRVGRLLQVQVQRRHAAFDVDVADDHGVGGFLDQLGHQAAQLVQQGRREARARQRHLRVFPGVGHAADAVVQFHHLVLAPHGGVVHAVLVDAVLDQLEHIGIGRQREHAHHHALDAGRDVEGVARMRQMVQEVAVEQRLALLLQPDHGVQLGLGLARQQRGQEVDHGGRRFHVHQEIGAREAEQRAQVVGAQQQRVQRHLSGRVARERHGEG